MDNVKNDRYYVEKIISDLEFLIKHTQGKSKTEIKNNEVLLDSIMFRIIQIAENVAKLTDDFKAKHSDVPWLAIRGMRNRIVHDYGVVDITVIFNTISNDMPEMHKILTSIF